MSSSAVVSHGTVCTQTLPVTRVWPGEHSHFLIPVQPRWDPLARPDAIPLWWMLWDAQNWRHLQNKQVFLQRVWQRWSTQMGNGCLGGPQVCKKQPNLQRWRGRREPAFPGSTRGYQGVYSARKPLRPAGLKGRKDSAKRSCSQILYCICLILQLDLLALTDHSYRDWKPFEKLTSETKVLKKNNLVFLLTC